jgi:hypothetical protein
MKNQKKLLPKPTLDEREMAKRLAKEKPCRRIVGECTNPDHSGDIREEEFEYKGCWLCLYFKSNDVLVSSGVAAGIYNVSESTIIRWIKKGKIKGRLYERVRKGGFENPKRYFVENPRLSDKLVTKQ